MRRVVAVGRNRGRSVMRGRILWSLVGLVVLLSLAAGGVFGLQWQAELRLDQMVATLRAALPAGVTLQIGSRQIGLFDRAVDFSDIVFDDSRLQGSQVKIAHVRLDGLDPDIDQAIRFRHIDIRAVDLSDRGDSSKAAIAGVTADAIDLPIDALKLDPAGLARIGIGAAAISDIRLTAPDGGFEFAGLSIAGLQGGMLDQVSFTGFHSTFPDADVGSVDMALGDGGCTEIAVLALADGSYATRPGGAIGGCRLGGASFTTPRGKGTLRAARFAITARDGEGRPIAGNGDVEGLTLHLPEVAELTNLLARLGTPDLSLSIHAEGHADPTTHSVTASESFTIDHAGEFGLDIAMGNLTDPALFETAPLEALPAAMKMTLGAVRVGWTDHGLIPAIEAETLGDGAALEQVPTLVESQIRDALKALGVAETTGDWPAKLAAFLRKPNRIEITLKPVKAVEIGTLMDESLPPAAKFGLLQPSLAVELKP
jgi:hypothetical protein